MQVIREKLNLVQGGALVALFLLAAVILSVVTDSTVSAQEEKPAAVVTPQAEAVETLDYYGIPIPFREMRCYLPGEEGRSVTEWADRRFARMGMSENLFRWLNPVGQNAMSFNKQPLPVRVIAAPFHVEYNHAERQLAVTLVGDKLATFPVEEIRWGDNPKVRLLDSHIFDAAGVAIDDPRHIDFIAFEDVVIVGEGVLETTPHAYQGSVSRPPTVVLSMRRRDLGAVAGVVALHHSRIALTAGEAAEE